ncbi:MAG: hypothetical protein ACC661_02805 [Verrucomicrobiales bacterium]
MTTPASQTDDRHYKPGIGCFIIGLGLFMLVGSLSYALYRGVQMDREIDTFTAKTPVVYPVEQPTEAQVSALREKISAFGEAALAGESVDLALSAIELNRLISSAALLADFRGNTVVTGIGNELIVAEISQQMNSLMPGNPRWLNATFSFHPLRTEDTISLQLIDITAPGVEIPRGFISLYAQKKYFQLDAEDPTIGQVIKEIRRISTAHGELILSTGSE